MVDQAHAMDLEAKNAAKRREGRNVAGATGTQAEVLSHVEGLDGGDGSKRGPNELVVGNGRDALVKG